MKYHFWLFLIWISVSMPVWGIDEDAEINKAISEVQDSLRSEKSREGLIETDSAKEVSKYVKEISGSSADEQAIYELAASVMGNFKGKRPNEMAQILEAASKNPEAFAHTFTPAQRRQLKELAERLPASKNQKAP